MTLNEYATAEHALKYLVQADQIPHRTEGEAVGRPQTGAVHRDLHAPGAGWHLLQPRARRVGHAGPPGAFFLSELGITEGTGDPSNKLARVEPQLQWLREIGFTDVDCYWKWLELAVFGGVKPAG